MAGEVDTPSGVAGRYANALFELALEEKALEKVEQNLNRFAEALDAVEDLRRLVKSPVFSAEEQERAIAAVLAEIQIEGLTANFLKLVAKNRRLFAAPDMIKAFRALLAQHRGLTSAEVTSAVPLAVQVMDSPSASVVTGQLTETPWSSVTTRLVTVAGPGFVTK